MYYILKNKSNQISQMNFNILKKKKLEKTEEVFYPRGMKSGPSYIMSTLQNKKKRSFPL